MDYQAAYVCLREAILRAMGADGPEVKQILNEALDAAPTASDGEPRHASALEFLDLAAAGARSDAIDGPWREAACELVDAGWRIHPPD